MSAQQLGNQSSTKPLNDKTNMAARQDLHSSKRTVSLSTIFSGIADEAMPVSVKNIVNCTLKIRKKIKLFSSKSHSFHNYGPVG
jgi:hypothetical protein